MTHIFVEIAHDSMHRRGNNDKSDERVFMHFHPRGKKRNVREFLKTGDREDTYLTAQVEINVDIPLLSRQL